MREEKIATRSSLLDQARAAAGPGKKNPTETCAAAASPVPQARDVLRDRIESATDAQWFRSRQKKEP